MENWNEQRERLALMMEDDCFRRYNLDDKDRAAIREALRRADVADRYPKAACSPVDIEWLTAASEEDLLACVDGDAMNLALAYLTWHQELLKKSKADL